MLTSVISAAANARDLEAAERWRAKLPEAGVGEDAASWTALLNAAAKVGNLTAAEQHLQRALEGGLRPTTITLNTLIDAAAKAGDASAAERLFNSFRTTGIEPDVITFTGLINAAGKQANRRPAGAARAAGAAGVAGAAGAAGVAGAASGAERWFRAALDAQLRPDAVMLTALINADAAAGHYSPQRWLDLASHSRVQLNAFAYASLVTAAARQSDLGAAEHWLERNAEGRVLPSVVAYTAVIQAAGRSRQPDAAKRRLRELMAAAPRRVDRTLALAACRAMGQDSFEELCREVCLDPDPLLQRGESARSHGRRERDSLTGAALSRVRDGGLKTARKALRGDFAASSGPCLPRAL